MRRTPASAKQSSPDSTRRRRVQRSSAMESPASAAVTTVSPVPERSGDEWLQSLMTIRNESKVKENDAAQQQTIEELKAENAKLRDIESQFWSLLQEREELQEQLNQLRSMPANSQRSISSSLVLADEASKASAAASHDLEKLRADYDRMAEALKECMDLLLVRDQGGDVTSQWGSVSAYLAWCELEANKSSADRLMREHRNKEQDRLMTRERSPERGDASPRGLAFTAQERATLLNQLRSAQAEARQLQDELDRTDLSRLQALEDATQLQSQVTTLSQSVSELRAAYNEAKTEAVANANNAAMAFTLRSQLADSEAEIAQLKGTIAQLQRLSDVGGAQLAADAARIRNELAARAQAKK